MSVIEVVILAGILLFGLALIVGIVQWVRRRSGAVSTQSSYTRALSALINGDRREALVQLKLTVQEDSGNLDAYLRLGDLLRESGDPQKALAIHRDLTVRPKLRPAERVRILESITRDHLAANRYREAAETAERILAVDRSHRFARAAVRDAAEALGDWTQAIRAMADLTRETGSTADLAAYYGFVGEQLVTAGDVKAGRQHFLQARKVNPDCVMASIALGDLDQKEGSLDKAVKHWHDTALAHPEHAPIVFDRLERAYFDLGRFPEVVSFYRELLHRTPREASVPAVLALAEIHRRKGSLDEAETFLLDALEIDPDHPKVRRLLIRLAIDRRDPEGALTEADRLLGALGDEAPRSRCRHCRAAQGPAWRCARCRGLDPLGLS